MDSRIWPLLVLTACGGGAANAPVADGPVPEFGLQDVNATSQRLGQTVSPRDYLGQVSAWYFGHST